MTSSLLLLILVVALAVGVSIATAAVLRGWNGWLELRRSELDRGRRATPAAKEIAELRQRIRRLESIADGDD
jgi:hypothetical protein